MEMNKLELYGKCKELEIDLLKLEDFELDSDMAWYFLDELKDNIWKDWHLEAYISGKSLYEELVDIDIPDIVFESLYPKIHQILKELDNWK